MITFMPGLRSSSGHERAELRNCPQVRRLAQLSLLAVMRDIVPGYRVRLPTEKELAVPVSKDVQRVRDYESTLLRLYQVWPPARLGRVESGYHVIASIPIHPKEHVGSLAMPTQA